jgi:hypothetical protein
MKKHNMILTRAAFRVQEDLTRIMKSIRTVYDYTKLDVWQCDDESVIFFSELCEHLSELMLHLSHMQVEILIQSKTITHIFELCIRIRRVLLLTNFSVHCILRSLSKHNLLHNLGSQGGVYYLIQLVKVDPWVLIGCIRGQDEMIPQIVSLRAALHIIEMVQYGSDDARDAFDQCKGIDAIFKWSQFNIDCESFNDARSELTLRIVNFMIDHYFNINYSKKSNMLLFVLATRNRLNNDILMHINGYVKDDDDLAFNLVRFVPFSIQTLQITSNIEAISNSCVFLQKFSEFKPIFDLSGGRVIAVDLLQMVKHQIFELKKIELKMTLRSNGKLKKNTGTQNSPDLERYEWLKIDIENLIDFHSYNLA